MHPHMELAWCRVTQSSSLLSGLPGNDWRAAGSARACTTLRLGLTCVPTPQQGACRHAEEGPSAPAGQAAGHRSHAGGHSSRGRGGRQGGVHAVHPQPSAGEPQLAVQLLSARAIIEFRAQSWS